MPPEPGYADGLDADTSALLAHGLLNSAAVIVTASTMLHDQWDRLEPDVRQDVLDMIRQQGRHLVDTLGGMARGLAPEVIDYLDTVSGERHTALHLP